MIASVGSKFFLSARKETPPRRQRWRVSGRGESYWDRETGEPTGSACEAYLRKTISSFASGPRRFEATWDVLAYSIDGCPDGMGSGDSLHPFPWPVPPAVDARAVTRRALGLPE